MPTELVKISEGVKHYELDVKEKGEGYANGKHATIFFPNGYGASIIDDGYGKEMGLLELAVVEGDKDHWDISHDTPITSDVIGHLTMSEVQETLAKIEALPKFIKIEALPKFKEPEEAL